MSYRFHIDKSVNCAFVQHFDTFAVGEVTEQMAQLESHSNFIEGLNILRDVSQTNLPVEYDHKWFANFAKTTLPDVDNALGTNSRVAWVLSNRNDYIKIHQWCATTRLSSLKIERRPFRDITKAMNWLGLPDDYKIKYLD